jgi:chemotaxis signal transduction protein
MSATVTAEIQSTPIGERFIVTQVERMTLVFPAGWVAEIMRLERSQILDLPFYDPMLLGVTHHNGNVLPLISAHRLLKIPQFTLREISTVVRLNDTADRLANVGVVVDRVNGSSSQQELPPALFDAKDSDATVLINSELLPSQLWHPQRWRGIS